jgi:GTP-binding protein
MNLESVFVKSSVMVSDMPKAILPEYAFIGRSNVGKSSLINMLTGQKKLAKTSGSPGKTQTVNHFIIQKNWYIVDLPGYGYAKVSKKEREKWQLMIRKYFQGRPNLLYTFLLIDCRHEPQKADIEFANFLGELQVPFVLVFTKADKLGASTVQSNIAAFKREMLKWWTELPPIFQTSSVNQQGRDELLKFIKENNETYRAEILTALQNE